MRYLILDTGMGFTTERTFYYIFITSIVEYSNLYSGIFCRKFTIFLQISPKKWIFFSHFQNIFVIAIFRSKKYIEIIARAFLGINSQKITFFFKSVTSEKLWHKNMIKICCQGILSRKASKIRTSILEFLFPLTNCQLVFQNQGFTLYRNCPLNIGFR